MTKASIVIALMVTLTGAALADDKVDAAKTETCEKAKTFLAEQKAKGKCAAEADAAAKVTCAAATFKTVSDLLARCTSAPAEAKPTSGVPRCRALDADNAIIEEAEDKVVTKCTTRLLDKLKKRWCTAENKGKRFDYTTDFDHVVGKGSAAKKVAGKKQVWTCRTVAK